MKRKSLKKVVRKSTWDPQKDSIFKELSGLLLSAGISVRREDLKQGHGWRVMSGSCRVEGTPYIFVDKKLSQDDQITFLAQKIVANGVTVPGEKIELFPERVRGILGERKAA